MKSNPILYDQEVLNQISRGEIDYVIFLYPKETLGEGVIRKAIPNPEDKVLVYWDARRRNRNKVKNEKIFNTLPEDRVVKMKNLTTAKEFCKRGNVFWALGLMDEAFKDFNRTITKCKNIPIIYEFFGDYYAGLGDFNRAIVNFTKAIELKPDNYRVYYYRAMALDKNGNHKEAIADCTRAIAINPYFADAYCGRGRIYGFIFNDLSKGIADCTRAISLDPGNVDAYCGRGFFLLKLKKVNLAENDFKKALELDPDDYEAKSGLKIIKQLTFML